MRKVAVVTTSRADYGYYRPILRRIVRSDALELSLLVAGMHLAPEYGQTILEIEKDGYTITEKIDLLLAGDSPQAIAKSIGLGAIGFGQSFARIEPDILLLLGDRYEMLAAGIASLPFNFVRCHLHGGELSEGAFDDAIRHSLTKMCHFHMVATETYRQRVIQLGEQPDRVFVTGASSLDNLNEIKPLSRKELEVSLGFPLTPSPLLVTCHPSTLEPEATETEINQLIKALKKISLPVVFTYPNADTNNRIIIQNIKKYQATSKNVHFVANLGMQSYFSLMTYAVAMVGNSSSGIIEAASFKLPVVNIGDRQRGRLHGPNVIDVATNSSAIQSGIKRATSKQFRDSLNGLINPYGDGKSAKRIVDIIKKIDLGPNSIKKSFYDIQRNSD